jgi:hypothetical protein
MSQKSHRLGLWIAIAALCVNAPRLVQAFLEADGLQLNPQLRPVLMGATGVAAALTLTGGGAWLAHELARGAARLQGLLLTCWSLVLVGQLVLIPPLLMAEMATSRLGTVLPQSWQRWGWAFVAVLLVELVAAGAMVAQGRRSQWQEAQVREERALEQIALERNALERKLRAEQEHSEELRMLLNTMQESHAQDEEHDPGASVLKVDALDREHRPSMDAQAGSYPCRNGCGWVGKSPRAENAHLRFCRLG